MTCMKPASMSNYDMTNNHNIYNIQWTKRKQNAGTEFDYCSSKYSSIDELMWLLSRNKNIKDYKWWSVDTFFEKQSYC